MYSSAFYVDQQPFLVAGLNVLGAGQQPAGLAMQGGGHGTGSWLSTAADGVLEHPPRRGRVFASGDTTFLLGPYEEAASGPAAQ